MSRSVRFVSRSKKWLAPVGAIIVVLIASVGAFAYWTVDGTGAGAATNGTLTAPGQPNVPTTGATVNLSWSAATVSGGGTVRYHVERRDDPGSSWTDVCASSDAAPISPTNCDDSPGNGTFVFRVTARYASWHTVGPESDPVTVSGDTTPPYVVSINRADPSPTNVGTVLWTVTFSETVTGVDASDFTLARTGVTGGTVTSVTGSGATRTVSATTGTGDGALGLSLADDNTIVDDASNPLGTSGGPGDGSFTGQAYAVDKTNPSVTSNQAAAQSDPTNASPINFTVVFSEAVTGFTASDVTLGGSASPTTALVSGSGTTYNVAVSGMSSQGTVTATIAADGANDAAGNGNTTSTSSDNAVTYDTQSPTVTVNQKAGQGDPTNTLPMLWTVTFSEPVTGFDASDLTRGGTTTAGTVSVSGSGANYELSLSGTPTNGTTSFTIAASSAKDAAGNNNTTSSSTDTTITYDTASPTVTINQASGQSDPTTGSPINFTVVFAESVSDFATGDVTLAGTAAGATAATVTGSGTTYNVAVTGMNANGTIIATVGAAKATDAAGNPNAASTSSDNTVTFTIDYSFVVSNPGTQTAGTAFGGLTIQLQANGVNTALLNGTPYTGAKTISFSGPLSSPGGTAPSYPATVTFAGGLATLPAASITLNRAAPTTLTASDNTPTPPIIGTSTNFTVSAGTAAKLAWTQITASSATAIPTPCYFTCSYAAFGNNSTFTANVSVTDSAGNVITALGAGHTVSVTTAGGGAFTSQSGANPQSLVIATSGAADSTAKFIFKAQTGSWTSDTLTAHVTGGTAYADATATLFKS